VHQQTGEILRDTDIVALERMIDGIFDYFKKHPNSSLLLLQMGE
jgi:hypothetical protein